MPGRLIVCPSCGNEVPVGRFCNSCGLPLPQVEIGSVTDSGSEDSLSQSHPDVKKGEIPRFSLTISGMDSLASASLLSRAELEIIDEELDQLIEQIGATRQALQLKEADKSVLTSRANDLRKSFETTKKRRAELARFGSKLPLEVILNNLQEQESKLEKLEAAQDSIDSAIYKEQRSQLQAGIKALEKELKGAVKDADRWLKGIGGLRKALLKDESRLEARYKIGDVSPAAYDKAKAENDRAMRTLDVCRRILDETLANAKKR
jgi:chromosome segregation ATPase